MHPIFVTRQRLGLYLLAWLPLAALLAALLVLSGGSPHREAITLALPLTLVYAFVCLAAWYPCRAMPLHRAGIVRAMLVHGTTAVISAIVWVAMAWGLANILERSGVAPGASGRVADEAALVFSLGVLIFLLSVAIHYLLVAFERSRQAERDVLQAKVLAKDAELQLLRTQIDPHFLFNSLNSISSLTSVQPEAARQMCIELGDFLRRTLRLSSRQTIPLADELDLVRCYLAIEKVRFGDRLGIEEHVEDGCMDDLVPCMILQPLVENAVKHGIANLLEGGIVRITVRCDSEHLRLEVFNPVDPEAPRTAGEGMGLDNLRRRLRTLYGDDAFVNHREKDGGFWVQVVLPAEKGLER